MTYALLLERVWHPPLAFEDKRQSSLPAELELQALWFSGAFGRDFKTTDGRSVRIIQFGEWNRGSGPDFTLASLEIDGAPRSGAIELDPDAASWENHGHAADPAFRDCALHVVFRADPRRPFTRTDDHREVPQVLIPDHLLDEALNLPPRAVAIAHPGRCHYPLKHMPAAAVGRLLEEAAAHRAAAKATRWLRTADARGREEALFQATADTLGYQGNSLALRLLVQRLPLAELRHAGPDAEALLFGAAGFLSPKLHEAAPPETRDYLRSLWETWWKHRTRWEMPGREIPWKTHGQRPANHPHRRLAALATLLSVWPQYRRLALARPLATKPVLDFLQSLRHPFWSHHHTLTSPASPRPIALFGRSRGTELLANHLIPLALHEGGMTAKAYLRIRQSDPNDKVKRCAIRLFGSLQTAKPWLRRVAHHQALLQVYRDFCLEDASDCHNCPFPEQLSQWRG